MSQMGQTNPVRAEKLFVDSEVIPTAMMKLYILLRFLRALKVFIGDVF